MSEEFKKGSCRNYLFHSAKVGLCFPLCTFKVRISIVYTDRRLMFMTINGEGKALKSIKSSTLPD